MEFSITLRIGTKRNDNFYFLYFPSYSNLFWLIKPHWYFLIFLIFLPFFWNFLSRLGKEWNGTIIFIFLVCILFQPILARKEFIMVFFNFLNFFVIFLEFSITHRVGTKRNDNFYFLSFSSFSILFWLEMNPFHPDPS